MITKEEEPAESVERRVLTKRNSPHESATSTQCEGQAKTGLERVREAAQREKTLQFNNLLHHITPVLLVQAYYALKHTAASGVDKVSWYDYNQDGRVYERMQALHQQIQTGCYRPQPSKRIWIGKDDGKQRPIGISRVEDKIVQQALTWVLQAIYETDFYGFSYGFRPGRHQHQALDAVTIAITEKKVSWILDADIKGFFDNIDHEWLVMLLGERIADKRVIDLCIKMLRAGVMEENTMTKTDKGTAQGSVISPLFANVFLHYVLDQWVQHWRKHHSRGEVYIVRYADDFVIGLQYKSDGEALHRALGHRLERFGLQLHETKTQLLEFGRFAAENRRARGEGKPEVFHFLGFTHRCSTRRNDGGFTVRRVTQKKKLHNKLKELKQQFRKRITIPLKEQIKWVRSVITGHMNYYGVPGNHHAMSQFRKEVCRIWYRTLRRRSHKAQKLSWDKMRKFVAQVVPSMRAVHPYPSQRFYV